LHRRKQISNLEKNFNFIKENIMFGEFHTIKHTKNFEIYNG